MLDAGVVEKNVVHGRVADQSAFVGFADVAARESAGAAVGVNETGEQGHQCEEYQKS